MDTKRRYTVTITTLHNEAERRERPLPPVVVEAVSILRAIDAARGKYNLEMQEVVGADARELT